ncbi:monocarboxylate transporter 12-like, partial [Glandiceps talaboti]
MDRKVMPIGKGPDGGWGWMVVLATGTGDAIISTFAFVMSPIFIELRRYFNATAEETSWFLSLQCISFALAFIGTSSSDRIGARNTVIIFGSLATFGIFISQFAWNIYYLYVSIGLITGLGFSGSLSPLHVMTARYFPQRYPLATGIAMVGPGLWLFISPPIVQACVDRYGWRGAFLIESAIIGNLLVCGAILRPLRSVKNTQENTFCKRGQRPITDALENGECRDSEKSEDCTPEKTKSGNSYLADCFALYREPRFMTFVVSRFLLGCAYSGAMLHLQPRSNVAMVGTSQQTAFLVSI